MRHHDVPELESEALTPKFLASLDAALIVTDHTGFNYADIVQYAPLVIDTRNATRAVSAGRSNIVHA